MVKLLLTPLRPTKKRTTLAQRSQVLVKLVQNRLQIVDNFVDLGRPHGFGFAHCVVHLSNHSHVHLLLLLIDFFILA